MKKTTSPGWLMQGVPVGDPGSPFWEKIHLILCLLTGDPGSPHVQSHEASPGMTFLFFSSFYGIAGLPKWGF